MVLIVADHQDGKLKKIALEAATFGKHAAEALGTTCKGLVIGNVDNAADLGLAGASEVLQVPGVEAFDDQVYSSIIAQVAEANNAKLVILSHSSTGKALLGRLAVKIHASSASSVNQLEVDNGSVIATRPSFSGKAIEKVKLLGDRSVVSMMPNSVQPESSGSHQGN